MAGAAGHAIDRVKDGGGGDGSMFGAKSANEELIRWKRRQMGFCGRGNQGFGERQTATIGCRLQDNVDVL